MSARSHAPEASRSLEELASLALWRTADVIQQGFEKLIKPWGISGTQYNILRILRGAGPEGLTCGQAACRMIRHDPDITRLLDRLEARQLVCRSRHSQDRRVIMTRITSEGLRILKELDEPVAELHRRQVGHLGERRLKTLTRLLELCQMSSGEVVSSMCGPAAGGRELDSPAGRKKNGGTNGR